MSIYQSVSISDSYQIYVAGMKRSIQIRQSVPFFRQIRRPAKIFV